MFTYRQKPKSDILEEYRKRVIGTCSTSFVTLFPSGLKSLVECFSYTEGTGPDYVWSTEKLAWKQHGNFLRNAISLDLYFIERKAPELKHNINGYYVYHRYILVSDPNIKWAE